MEYYLYILAFHVVSFMSWMATMFYLPRLFVYHQEHSSKSDFVQVVEIQEFMLYKYIGLPALWATIISGAVLLYLNPALFQMPWMHLKLAALVLLVVYHFSMEYYRVQLKNKKCFKGGQFFRAYNEIPTLLSILIVAYVVTKETLPFFSVGITLFFGYVIYKIATLKKQS